MSNQYNARQPSGIWADKGEMSERNPRYIHAKILSGSGYTPEPIDPPEGWIETHGTGVFPIERIEGDDWTLLEDSEDLSSVSRIEIALEVMKGLQHIRDQKRVLLWDIKPEHIMIQGFRPPDDVSRITVKFIDLETIFLVDANKFSTLGEPTSFTLNCIARQQSIMVQGGIFDPELEIIELIMGYLRDFADESPLASPEIDQELDAYWRTTFNSNFENFIECLQNILEHEVNSHSHPSTNE